MPQWCTSNKTRNDITGNNVTRVVRYVGFAQVACPGLNGAFFTGAGDTNGQFSNAVNQETTASNESTTEKPLLSLGKTNSFEVLEVMKKMRPNKATGHGLIPPKVIQQAAGVLCHHFSTLFNYVLDQAKIPQQWKLAEISPAHKKECKLTKSNYR